MTIDKCRTCKHAFTTGKNRLYCKKSLADKDDCGEYSVIEQFGVNGIDGLISKRAVNILVDELARAISDERCCMSRGRSTATIMQDILDLPPVTPKSETVTEFADRCCECGKMRTGHWIIMGGRYLKCSECKHITKTESPDIYNFCMVCGTKMSENPTYPESEGKNGWV